MSIIGRRFLASSSYLALMAGLNPVLAAPPAALDRVPDNAPVVVALRSMKGATDKINAFTTATGLPKPEGDDNPLNMAEKMLGTPGLNKEGSMAVAIVPGPDGKVVMGEDAGDDTTAVIIIPVSDYAALVKAMDAEKGDGVSKVKVDGKDGFIKDLTGGYAALSIVPGLLEKFEGGAGHNAKHAAMLGKNGGGIADSADVLLIANFSQLQDRMKEAAQQMKEQAEQMAAMMGDQGAGVGAGLGMMQTVLDTMAKDASCGVLGLSFSDAGASVQMGTQFREGTESAKMFSSPGKSAALMGRVPNQPFYFAGAFDTSSTGVKQVLKQLSSMQAQGEGAAGPISFLAAIDKIGGFSGVLGASPNALMGSGLFVNTSTYVATNDPAAYTAMMAEEFRKSDGRKQGPITTRTTYEPGAAEVAGVKADKWSMTMDIDPNDPTGMQAQMMTSMLFGAGAFEGMNAPVDGGVVSTYSANTPLLTSAIEAAKSGKGLADSESLKAVSANLPADRSFEFYIGVKPLMDAAIGFASMMGGGPDITVPEKISPIGLAGTTTNGGMTVRLFVPMDTIKTIATVVKQMDAGDEGDGMDDAPAPRNDGDKPPRF
jgi:hypothetical protein